MRQNRKQTQVKANHWLFISLQTTNLEVVYGSLNPRSTVGGVVEVADVDCPHGDTDQGDHLGLWVRIMRDNTR